LLPWLLVGPSWLDWLLALEEEDAEEDEEEEAEQEAEEELTPLLRVPSPQSLSLVVAPLDAAME